MTTALIWQVPEIDHDTLDATGRAREDGFAGDAQARLRNDNSTGNSFQRRCFEVVVHRMVGAVVDDHPAVRNQEAGLTIAVTSKL